MAIRLMTAVWDDESLPRGDVLLMLALADHANDEGACFPSINRLARRTRSSPSTVRRHLRSLREAGRVTVDAREGTSNVYRIVLRGAGWAYGNGAAGAPCQSDTLLQNDTPRGLTPLSPRDRGTPATAVAGRGVRAVAPEPSRSPSGTDRYAVEQPSVDLTPETSVGAIGASQAPGTSRPLAAPESAAWAATKAELVSRFPDVAWRGWSDRHDAEAERHLARLGADVLIRVAGRPKRPDLSLAWLKRWEHEPATRASRPTQRCLDHHVTHHGTCPGCRADQLAAR
ncbi:helix-turn-helix domain-containing protein [Aquipuribacter sp. SD81]|uniref:helix-turn-helix domain-containing protein n=1 Tax=Aquipuribacter sp. SD81 TaxID=3127703 RepID=UPI00301943E7